jgi:predicted secreted protein
MSRFVLPFIVAALLGAIGVLQADGTPAAPVEKAPKPKQLIEADNGKTVVLPVGAKFDVVLKGNASTGFQWQLDSIDGAAVRQVGKAEYILDKNPKRMAGVGGKFVFHFKVTKAAKTNVRLAYFRPWEKNTRAEQTFEVTIDSLPQTKVVADDALVFDGTVASIEASPLPESTQNFVVTMKVDRVTKGQFQGKTFQFRIHSPSRSGLETGQKCTVEAKRTADGYVVDQNQWMMRPLGGQEPPKDSP